jgi:hypothetical protein
MFKEVSQCIPAVSILYFGPFSPFHYSPLPLYLQAHFSTAFNTHPYILYLHLLWCVILLMCCLLFSFPSFLKFHRVVPLLQTCSTSEFIHDRACFGVYVYLWIDLWIYLPYMRENMQLLCFYGQFLKSSDCSFC